MTIENQGHEHEFEPQFGLPERLPANERILWQGAPDLKNLARRTFHLRKLAWYFGLLIAWRIGTQLSAGAAAGQVLDSLRLLAPLALLGLAAVGVLAWLTARTTAYTLTDKRVVMRIGIVLTVTFNLPLRTLAGAALRLDGDGCGDITLTLSGEDRIAWLHLWPHVRPWRLARPEPMLRAIPDAAVVAARLTQAWSAVTGGAPTPEATRGVARTESMQWRPSPT